VPCVLWASCFRRVERVGFPDVAPAALGPLDPIVSGDLAAGIDGDFIVAGRPELDQVIPERTP
jgi:hypothetical protein